MHNPPHPGTIVKKSLIDNTDLTVTSAAELLGVNRVTLSNLVNCKSSISPDMAIRLSKALETSSEMWVNMQAMYDLAQAEKNRRKIKVKPLRKIQKNGVRKIA